MPENSQKFVKNKLNKIKLFILLNIFSSDKKMNVNTSDIGNLDFYIEQLLTCKPLKESEVKFICDKVQ